MVMSLNQCYEVMLVHHPFLKKTFNGETMRFQQKYENVIILLC